MNKIAVLLASSAASIAAFAHGGHGLEGGHWHATDAWGFVAAGAFLVALLVWFGRGRK